MELFATAVVLSCLVTMTAAVTPCEQSPLTHCDFVFRGSWTQVPAFKVPPHATNVVLSRQPLLHKSGNLVITATSDSCVFADKLGGACQGAFFFTSANGDWNFTNVVGSHPIIAAQVNHYRSRCVLLPMNNIQIGRIGWVNVGGQYQQFPKARRCVVFSTSA